MKKSILLSLFIFSTNLLFAQNSGDILGVWLNEEGDAQIEVFKAKELFFGKIVWLEKAKHENGDWMLDEKNPSVKMSRASNFIFGEIYYRVLPTTYQAPPHGGAR